MVAIPAPIPDTNPVADTVAIAVFELLQLPPVDVVLNAVVVPAQIVLTPVIAAGVAQSYVTDILSMAAPGDTPPLALFCQVKINRTVLPAKPDGNEIDAGM